MKIVTIAQMQQAERGCSQFGVSLDMLMQNAGKAVAEEIGCLIGDLHKQNILVLVGPGNNGGDGLVAARYLHDWGARGVRVYLCGQRPNDDANLREVTVRGIPRYKMEDDIDLNQFNEWLFEATIVLDAVFGTGKSRPVSGTVSRILNSLDEAKKHRPHLNIMALDLPSGLNADTGTVDPSTPAADHTLTLGFPKIGLFNLPGAEKAGNIAVVDIGIPASLVESLNIELLDSELVRSLLPKRPLVSHKGTYGKVLAIAGSMNYIGAAYLACSASLRVGAGLTTLALAQSLQPILASKLTEVTYLPLPEDKLGYISAQALLLISRQSSQYDTLLIGCGLGTPQSHIDLVNSLLFDSQVKLPSLVLDADGLNIVSDTPGWWERFTTDSILTPHAGEMSRLLHLPVEEIQANRLETARQSAVKWHKTVVLKGAYTVIAAPDGRVRVSPFASAGLATAGTGDVLAGAIAGFVAQGLQLFDAASCGVYVHGLAGKMVEAEFGNAGMLASDLLPVLPKAIRQLKSV
jgi:ADP-dependent NAD(P)H-hydrate dehydratase / NAD(P)H-hydrate epimerase